MAPFLTVRSLTALALLVPAVPVGTALVPDAGVLPHAYAASPTPRPESSRAGSRAGEGRERPGRAGVDTQPGEADEPTATEPATDPGADTDADTATATATGRTQPEQDRPTGDPDAPRDSGATDTPRPGAAQPGSAGGTGLRVLPLGGGLILIGLGLGLAFVGLRLRQP